MFLSETQRTICSNTPSVHAHILTVDMLEIRLQAVRFQSVESRLGRTGESVKWPWPAFFSLFASLDFLACMATLRNCSQSNVKQGGGGGKLITNTSGTAGLNNIIR